MDTVSINGNVMQLADTDTIKNNIDNSKRKSKKTDTASRQITEEAFKENASPLKAEERSISIAIEKLSASKKSANFVKNSEISSSEFINAVKAAKKQVVDEKSKNKYLKNDKKDIKEQLVMHSIELNTMKDKIRSSDLPVGSIL